MRVKHRAGKGLRALTTANLTGDSDSPTHFDARDAASIACILVPHAGQCDKTRWWSRLGWQTQRRGAGYPSSHQALTLASLDDSAADRRV